MENLDFSVDQLRTGFAFIMPCMGRLDHVKQSVPALLQSDLIDGENNLLVFVDFHCPQDSGKWVRETYGDRVHVIEMGAAHQLAQDEVIVFNKPLALNSGALEAIARGAQYLIFIDADTIASPALFPYLLHNLSLNQFLIFEPSLEWRDLTGFLAVHRRHFIKVTGYDIHFNGWGAEDLEMRVKLFLQGAAPQNNPRAALTDPENSVLRWGEIPGLLASAIQHSDERRMENYQNKDKEMSHGLNMNLLCSNIYNRLGVHLVDLHETPLGPAIRRLIGMELLINPRAIE